ncbi:uracil phosphoribosyltransferase [Zhouia sp. PK063]|uniref:DUF6341 family protein n=1 Tax=Zhouia sp. PK063 TaxID=3373602 RepID=UPI0037A67EC0
MMRDIFEGIASLFENVLFWPLNQIRTLQDSTWWGANAINFIFILIGFCALIYWLKQMKMFADTNQEDETDKTPSLRYKKAKA